MQIQINICTFVEYCIYFYDLRPTKDICKCVLKTTIMRLLTNHMKVRLLAINHYTARVKNNQSGYYRPMNNLCIT